MPLSFRVQGRRIIVGAVQDVCQCWGCELLDVGVVGGDASLISVALGIVRLASGVVARIVS